MNPPVSLDDIRRNGREARRDCIGFFDNPFGSVEYNSMPSTQWSAAHAAWASGWLTEDNGRDQIVQRFLAGIELDSTRGFAPFVQAGPSRAAELATLAAIAIFERGMFGPRWIEASPRRW